MEEEPKGQPLEGADLTNLVALLREALYGKGERPEIRVEGVDESGLMSIAVISPEVTYRVRAPDVSALLALAGPRQQVTRDLAPSQLPYVSRTAPAIEVRELPLNGEPLSVVLAGPEAQTPPAIRTSRGEFFAAAAYTSRGPTAEGQQVEYKAFNEDAVVLRARRGGAGVSEIFALGAFDQAGGEGAVADSHGAASAAAARAFDAAVARIEAGADPVQALTEATARAGDGVRALGVGAMTTFAAVILIGKREEGRRACEAFVATVGDTRVLLVDPEGQIKERTRLHNLGAAITAGQVTDVPKEMALQFAGVLMRGVGGDDDSPDICRWTLAPGDRIVVETDGLGDARELEAMPAGVWHADRCADDQARVLAHVQSPAEAVQALVGYALDQMADQYGKPDNLGVVVAQVLGS